MSQAYSIRQLRKEGDTIAEIARKMGVSRTTVYKYLGEEDFAPQLPVPRKRRKRLDDYRPLIISWLEEDRRQWRKQRHSARRIWERLREEAGYDGGESTVRQYVHDLRIQLNSNEQTDGFLDQVWPPGEAQADFGEADFYILGVRWRMSFFVLSFPYSNAGFAQVFPGENAECVCQGLLDIFSYIGGVPTRILFDNATGVGRRVCDKVSTTETFAAFAAHFGFSFSFCNPNSGNEKGNVEAKVKYLRAHLFVPVPRFNDADAFNKRLLDKCSAIMKGHYAKGEPEEQLFMEDRLALLGLPQKPFEVVRYVHSKANKWGKICLDGRHAYSTDPSLAGQEIIAALHATDVVLRTSAGEFICRHKRAYGKAPTDTSDPASQLALLAERTRGWENSRVREALPRSLREHMDSLEKQDLRKELRVMRNCTAECGWEKALAAMSLAFEQTGRIDEAGVALAARGIGSRRIEYDEPVDLGIYDCAYAGERKA